MNKTLTSVIASVITASTVTSPLVNPSEVYSFPEQSIAVHKDIRTMVNIKAFSSQLFNSSKAFNTYVKKSINYVKYNVHLPVSFQYYIEKVSHKYHINPKLSFSVAYVESHYKPDAVSPEGDLGMFQIDPVNQGWLARKFGISNWFNPKQNAIAGIYMLSHLYKKYHNWNEVLIAYNAGESNMLYDRSVGIYETTYVSNVMDKMSQIAKA